MAQPWHHTYPDSLAAFDRFFPDERACRDYLFALRWPEGFDCPRCGHVKAWPVRAVRHQCAACGHQVSITAGTIFEGSNKPLLMWFRAVWLMTTQRRGVSAVDLQRFLGLGSYTTAWGWLQKLRRAMVFHDRAPLKDRVEVGYTTWGTEPTRPPAVIAIAAEVIAQRTRRIRTDVLPTASIPRMRDFVARHVEPGSTVRATMRQPLTALASAGYLPELAHPADSRANRGSLSARLHQAVLAIKSWLHGTHHGTISHEHLQGYLDEYVFRFNRRHFPPGQLFRRLLWFAVRATPQPVKALTRGVRGPKPTRRSGGET